MPEIGERLRQHGVRATRARVAVWDALHRADGHPTADELADELAGEVNLASVYRSLALFEELGLVQRSAGAGEASVWEPRHVDDQLHLVCTSCGRVTHHPLGDVARLLLHLDDDHGFDVARATMTVEGVCPTCR